VKFSEANDIMMLGPGSKTAACPFQ